MSLARVSIVCTALLFALAPRPSAADPSPDDSAAPGLLTPVHRLELGIFGGAFFPPRAHELYDLDVGQEPFDRVAPIFGARVAYLPFAFAGIELEGGASPLGLRDLDQSAVVYTGRAHLIGQLPFWVVQPFLLVGYGFMGVASSDDAVGGDIDGAFHAGVGAKWYPTRWLAVRLDGRLDISGELGRGGLMPHFELLAGVAWVIDLAPERGPDRDRDGVFDARDKCPEVAGSGPDGCPLDRDDDGIPDERDKCPELSGRGPDGCPLDRDNDGIPDDKDKCPDVGGVEPEGCPADKDDDGIPDDKDKCPDVGGVEPEGCPADKDNDGIPDDKDKCPDVGGVEPEGCPADKDDDGVPDDRDQCMDQPETINGYQDDDGCPDTPPKQVQPFTGTVRGITFRVDKATIRKRSYRTLNAAARVFKKHPKLRVRIVGHADDTGTDAYNLDLSRRRAEAVKAYLVKRGVAAERLETEGKGSSQPVVPGKTPSARAKNRRIEFKVLGGEVKAETDAQRKAREEDKPVNEKKAKPPQKGGGAKKQKK